MVVSKKIIGRTILDTDQGGHFPVGVQERADRTVSTLVLGD